MDQLQAWLQSCAQSPTRQHRNDSGGVCLPPWTTAFMGSCSFPVTCPAPSACGIHANGKVCARANRWSCFLHSKLPLPRAATSKNSHLI